MYDETFAFSAFGNAEERAKRYERNYLRGIGMPKDVANMVTFLLSDASVWVTGQSIVIDGGYLLGTLSKVLE
jgi:NAD(P)-dependent dehydrogenase (short-subunit alcohol dehydrogenase family)